MAAALAALAAPYEAAVRFDGGRAGYVYKQGVAGLGYYADAALANRVFAPPPDAPPLPEPSAEPPPPAAGGEEEEEGVPAEQLEVTVIDEVVTPIGAVRLGVMANISWCGPTPAQHGPTSNKMALITSGCGAMRSLGIKWPWSPRIMRLQGRRPDLPRRGCPVRAGCGHPTT